MGILLSFSLKPCYYIIYLYFRIHIEQKRMCNFGDTNFVNCIKMMASVVLVDMVKATLARTRLTSLQTQNPEVSFRISLVVILSGFQPARK